VPILGTGYALHEADAAPGVAPGVEIDQDRPDEGLNMKSMLVAICAFAYASTAWANSCANLDVIGTFDESGLHESEYGISAVGTFRIAGEADESRQPMFNLTKSLSENIRRDYKVFGA
jgi:hypothetical protein